MAFESECKHQFQRAAIERTGESSRFGGGDIGTREAEEMFAVRKKLRPAAIGSVHDWFGLGEGLARTAGVRNGPEPEGGIWPVENGCGGTPSAAAAVAGVGDDAGRAAGDIDAIHFAGSEIGDGAGIGRPERLGGAVGIGDELQLGIGQRANPKAAQAFFGGGDEGEVAAVGREHRWPGIISGEGEGLAIGREKLSDDGGRRFRQVGEVVVSEPGGEGREEKREDRGQDVSGGRCCGYHRRGGRGGGERRRENLRRWICY